MNEDKKKALSDKEIELLTQENESLKTEIDRLLKARQLIAEFVRAFDENDLGWVEFMPPAGWLDRARIALDEIGIADLEPQKTSNKTEINNDFIKQFAEQLLVLIEERKLVQAELSINKHALKEALKAIDAVVATGQQTKELCQETLTAGKEN